MSVCLSICLFVGVCVPVWFLVHMSKYVPIEQDLRDHVSYWIWRGLHIYVPVAIDWRQNANGHRKSSHVEVTPRMKFEKVISKAQKNMPAASQLTPDFRRSLSVNAISWSRQNHWKDTLIPDYAIVGNQTSDLRPRGPRTSGIRPETSDLSP